MEQTACDQQRLNWDAVIQITSFPIPGSASRPRFCHSFSWRWWCRATTGTRAGSQGPRLHGRSTGMRKSIGHEREISKGTGLEMLPRTPVPLQKLKHFLLLQQKEMLGPAQGSCSVPSGSSPIAVALAESFSATLPTACHPQLFLPLLSQVTVTDGRWRDSPGEYIQQPLNYGELYNFSKVSICPWNLRVIFYWKRDLIENSGLCLLLGFYL